MDQVQKEHQRLWKRAQSSKCINDVQATIDLLLEARRTIVDDPSSASITLAKLQNPVKASFEATNNDLKEAYSGLNKYTKALDKLFKDKPLPTTEYDSLSQPVLVNRAVAMHLLREGEFSTADTFLSEVSRIHMSSEPDTTMSQAEKQATEAMPDIEAMQSGEIRNQFLLMHELLYEMTEHQNLLPAIEWARNNREALYVRGSNLEFELCQLQFVWLFHGGKENNVSVGSGRLMALEYVKREFPRFQGRYLPEIQRLMGAMAFAPNLEDSPYNSIFNNPNSWERVATSFKGEFCALLSLAAESPLYVAATAGAIALPTLLKLQTIMKEKRTEWTSQNELPVEIPLPRSYQYHSIFVCPVSKEQTTDENPPMLIPCGHVIAQQSLARISKGVKFKCPYCPSESNAKDARKLLL
ncbi:macrophage erythroblast attacher [Arthroderma uncinatum]|uniref:macrophage erythroblast attacher n=1 Tax=Arthroderma uncinatum TaxID=74035 RepID=UPI00144A94ED|nr:macrophage erythroblast attacher [Arthroderma uncinatum]KAF3480678.1 macrophage erythroblast attacher [Arthroderma uncinatum]